LSVRTGTPLTITANNSLSLPGSTQTADQIAPVKILHGINVGNPWFSKESFATPVGQVWGTMGRNVFSGPSLFGLNVSLIRRIRIRERYELQLRADSLNVLNKAQFSNPQISMTNANFGYVTSTLSSGTGVNGTGGGRVVTGGIKVTF
jgi:hypothetical protein